MSIWVCWHRPPNRQKRFSEWSGSRSWADRGYFKIEDIEACEKAGIDPYVPRPQRGPSVRAGLFRKDEFRYDPTSDSFLCPAGQRLHPYSSSLMRGLKKINYSAPFFILKPTDPTR